MLRLFINLAMRILTIILLLIISISAIGQTTSDTTYAILKFDTLDSWVFKNAKPSVLSVNEINELDKIISNFFADHKYALLDIKKYKRQYFPVINDKGEKEVWVNCFCGHPDYDWKNKIVFVFDGGNCFFNVKVNLQTKKYYDLMINGEG